MAGWFGGGVRALSRCLRSKSAQLNPLIFAANYCNGVARGLGPISDEFVNVDRSKTCHGLAGKVSSAMKSNAAGHRSSSILRPYGFGPIGLDGLPESVNWNLVGAVTEVPDQKKLGSCWAFATTGSIESLDYITTGNLVKYSAQQLIDCNRLTNHYGCSVGYVEQTFDYIMSTEGIVRSDLYPYTGKRGACKPLMGEGVTVHGLGRVKPDSEYALKCAVAQQPVIVLINAHSEAFQNYKGGILYGDGAEMRELNHFVLCVGYDVSIDGDMFWILRNSWGEWWGIGGYVLIARETQKLAQSGGCFGIARKGLFPIGTSRKMVSVKCEKAIVSHISY